MMTLRLETHKVVCSVAESVVSSRFGPDKKEHADMLVRHFFLVKKWERGQCNKGTVIFHAYRQADEWFRRPSFDMVCHRDSAKPRLSSRSLRDRTQRRMLFA